MIKILIAEHLPLVRRGLLATLGAEPDLRVVAEVGSAEEVVTTARSSGPDVAVVDLDLPGLPVVAELAERVPQCRTLVLSARPDPGQARKALAGPALGFMSLCVPPERLAEGVRQVAAGRRWRARSSSPPSRRGWCSSGSTSAAARRPSSD